MIGENKMTEQQYFDQYMSRELADSAKRRKRFSPSKLIIYLLLVFWALTTIYPFVWVILNSFREKGMIRKDSFSVPWPGSADFTMDNYLTAFERADFKNAYINSITVSALVTLIVIFLAGLAAYGMVRYRFHGRRALYLMILASMMFPVFSTIIPVFRLQVVMGLASTGNRYLSLLSVVLPQIAGNLSFAIIVLMGFIRSVPIDLEESAFIDGAGVFRIFSKIILPVARPSFATVAIFTFLWSYNDLFTQTFFLRYPKEKTITLLLNEISSQAGVNYGLMAASVVLVVVPVLLVYIVLQKNIIKGMTIGAVKG
jgi:raffinose/stachyose/melibiose transport system permease protein